MNKNMIKHGLETIVAATALTFCTYNPANAARYISQQAVYQKDAKENAPNGSSALKYILLGSLGALATAYFFSGIRIVRPTEKGLVERLGKYKKVADQGFHWVIPIVDRMTKVNTTERMVNAQPQEVITKDNLNAKVDAQIYFKVKRDDESIKKSQYNVQDYERQIVALARTTLRAIIGNLSLKEANSMRDRLNDTLAKELDTQSDSWGIEVVRAELKEIDPPNDVQETMNKVVKAENEKIAAVDFATATETAADGERRAQIKKAEAVKQAKLLEAEGEAGAIKKVAEAKAEAIKVVNESSEKYFKGQAVSFRQLEVVENVMKNNTKYFLPQGTNLVAVLGEGNGNIVPLSKEAKQDKKA